jgi:hypothetical protein
VVNALIAGFDGDAIGDGQGEARALQECAKIANFAHRRDARGKTAGDFALRLCEAGTQFVKGLTA